MTDIFDFWAEVPGHTRVHPADQKVLNRSNHGFNLDCLPSNIDGKLKNARLVLLFVNPGMDHVDSEEAKTHEAQDKYVAMRSGTRPLRGPEDRTRAYKFTRAHTHSYGPWDVIRENVAVLNIAAYHSKQFKSEHMLAALPSSRVCVEWVQRVLFPQAESGERVVLCLRAARFWGLGKLGRYGEGLFAPKTIYGFLPKGPERNTIIDVVRRKLQFVGENVGSEVILELLGEGGAVTLNRIRRNQAWSFYMTTLDCSDLDDAQHSTISEEVPTLNDAFALLDKYPWTHLFPRRVHPSFGRAIWDAVCERTKEPNRVAGHVRNG